MGANLREAVRLVNDGAAIAYAPQPGPQTALLSCPLPDVLFGGARGGGKTYALLGDFLQHATLYGKGAKGIMFRRTYDELDEVKAQAQDIYPLIGAVWKESKSTWYFPNGAQLKLRYLKRDEDASHYQGHQYTWVGIDEAGNFPSPDPIDKLRATLRSKLGVPTFMRLTANPGGPGHAWLKARYIDPAPPMTPHQCQTSGIWRVFIPSRLADNAILSANDPTYEQRIRGSGPAWLVQAWLMGDWNATPEGGIWKAAWFKRYGTAPAAGAIVMSIDTAYKPKQVNDPSVCTVWKITQTGYYLLEVWRDRVDYPTLKHTVANIAAKWNPEAVLIEDKASGQSLIQELRASTRIPCIAIEPEGDKVSRAVGVASTFEAGLVFLPKLAPWLLDYEIECTIFPLAPNDDQVDSTSQFLKWAHKHVPAIQAVGAGPRDSGSAFGETGSQVDESRGFGTVRGNTDFTGFN
jgi:predicted phage terminase large subunit-like protein